MTYSYRTIGADLVEHAEIAYKHFRGRGFKVRREVHETDFPVTATLLCRRGHVHLIIEVQSKANMKSLRQWARYGQSCPDDTRVGLVLPGGVLRNPIEDQIRALKIGVFVSEEGQLVEKYAPRDLALGAAVPELKSLSPKMRTLFGESFEKFEGGDWREGFEEAARVVEEEARRYLQRGVKMGRLIVQDSKGRPKQPSAKQIKKMTMGQLRDTFGRIQTLSQADAIVYEVLDKVNPDRIGVVHKRSTKVVEKRLRRNVGQHMWRLVKAMRAMVGEAA